MVTLKSSNDNNRPLGVVSGFFNFKFQIRVHIVYYMVEVVCCFFISCLEQYIRADKSQQNLQRSPQPIATNTEWSYLKIPYISERLNSRITNIFRRENIPVRMPTNPTRSDKPYSTPPRSANALETNALSLGEGKRRNEFAEWHVAWFAE